MPMPDPHPALPPSNILCRVWHHDKLIATFTPTQPDQLRARILIADLNETVWTDFSAAFAQFMDSGETSARYACEACKTIEKFGEALQFRESFIVEFERQPPA